MPPLWSILGLSMENHTSNFLLAADVPIRNNSLHVVSDTLCGLYEMPQLVQTDLTDHRSSHEDNKCQG